MNDGKRSAVRQLTAWDRLERRFLLIAVVVALAVIVFYVAFHWAWRGAGIGNPDAWGTFGDYFSGTMNPLLGLFTLALLLATLNVTRKVRDDTAEMMEDQRKALAAQQQSMIEQITLLRAEAQERQQKSKLETIEGRLAAALEAWRELCDNATIRRDHNTTFRLRNVLYSKIEWNDFKARQGFSRDDPQNDEWKGKAKRALDVAGGSELKNLIPEFAQYCSDYEAAGGDRLVTNFYRSRLEQPLQRLVSVDYIDQHVARYLAAPSRVFAASLPVEDSLEPIANVDQE